MSIRNLAFSLPVVFLGHAGQAQDLGPQVLEPITTCEKLIVEGSDRELSRMLVTPGCSEEGIDDFRRLQSEFGRTIIEVCPWTDEGEAGIGCEDTRQDRLQDLLDSLDPSLSQPA